MDDWRRYTGTQMLQAIWTLIALAVGTVIQLLQPVVGGLFQPVVFLSVSGVWIAGLLVIALYDRRQWNRMVSGSSFRPDTGTRLADLESLKGGRSVTARTKIPDMFSQSHMNVRTQVEGVSASFTVELSYVGEGGATEGVQTGNDALDEAFVIEGSSENVSQLLSPEVQAKLMDIETPGTVTITGSKVQYEIPFTQLSPTELDEIADICLALAKRVESLAQS